MHRRTIPVVAAVIRNEQNQILITQRPLGKHLGGMWEFPGGKIDDGENARQALQRELREELGIETEIKELLWRETFTYPEKTVDIRFFACSLTHPAQTIQRLQVADFRWVSLKQLGQFSFPPADAAFIRKLTMEKNGN